MEEERGGEDRSTLQKDIESILLHVNELLTTAKMMEKRPVSQWLDSADQLARQLRLLSEKVAPRLENWVFLPKVLPKESEILP